MKDYEYDDGGAYVRFNECSECGATEFKESRISGVCVPCLSGEVWEPDVDAGVRPDRLVAVV